MPRAVTASVAHGVVMVSLGALGARPVAPALTRTPRRPVVVARAASSRAASTRVFSTSGCAHAPTASHRAARVHASAARVARVAPFPDRGASRRDERGFTARSRATDTTRAGVLGGDDAPQPSGVADEGDAKGMPKTWHRFLTRTTIIVAAMVVLYSASTPYGVNDKGVSFATATAKRLACVFLGRTVTKKVLSSKAARASAETLGVAVGAQIRASVAKAQAMSATLNALFESAYIASLEVLAGAGTAAGDGVESYASSSVRRKKKKKKLLVKKTKTAVFRESAPGDAPTRLGIAPSTGWRRALADAEAKFESNPRGILLIPVIAALVGWFTNWLAVKMIFYPIAFFGVPVARTVEAHAYGYPVLNPLGAFGWQGIVPAKAASMALTMVEMVTTKLIDVQTTFLRLDPTRMAQLFAPEVPLLAEEVAGDAAPRWAVRLGAKMVPAQCGPLLAGLEDAAERYVAGLVATVQRETHRLIDLKELVVKEMCEDTQTLVDLFQRCGRDELRFLTNSGLFFGFLLGCVQALAWLFYDNPWTLTVGGAIVGLATNWIALKCIFEPVEPVYLFDNPRLKLQGLFLRRQNEVSGEFSDHLASKVLTSEKVWDNMLHGGKAEEFGAVLEQYTRAFLTSEAATRGRALGFIDPSGEGFDGELDPELLSTVVAHLRDRLADHVHVLHEYSDDALGLRELMRERMALMTPSEFERVLHPIFEQDELTLIVSGAVLGAVAGFAQQVYTVAVDGGGAASGMAVREAVREAAREASAGPVDFTGDARTYERNDPDEAAIRILAKAQAEAAMTAARAAVASRAKAADEREELADARRRKNR